MGSCSTGSCGGNVGSPGFIHPTQVPQRGGLEMQTTGCADGSCGSSSTGSANGSCSGGSCGSKAAYQRAGCSGGSCGGKKAAKAGGCGGPGGCGGDEEGGGRKARKAEGGGLGLKATMMTVAATELAQLQIDYSIYLS